MRENRGRKVSIYTRNGKPPSVASLSEIATLNFSHSPPYSRSLLYRNLNSLTIKSLKCNGEVSWQQPRSTINLSFAKRERRGGKRARETMCSRAGTSNYHIPRDIGARTRAARNLLRAVKRREIEMVDGRAVGPSLSLFLSCKAVTRAACCRCAFRRDASAPTLNNVPGAASARNRRHRRGMVPLGNPHV